MRRATITSAVVAFVLAVAVPIALAYFSATKTSPQPISVAPTITITDAAAGHSDSSSGKLIDFTKATSFNDERFFPNNDDGFANANFDKVFATDRFYQWDYDSSLPPGQAVSGASFDFRFKSNGGAEVACFYFDVISGGSVIGTHGSQTPGAAGSPWCTDSSEKFVSTPIPEVNSTNIADGVKIKVYGYESNRKPFFVDEATVKGTTTGQNFTLYATTGNNQADGSAQTLPDPIAFEDSIFYTSTNNWPNAFDPIEFIEYRFSSGLVPSSAAIDSVTFLHRYQVSGNSTICYYLDVIASSGSLGTVPSPPGASGVSCAVGNSVWKTDEIVLPMVDTPAKTNGLVLRLIYRMANGGGQKSREDYAALKITYY